MARTTPELVAAIIEVDASVDLDPFIAAASAMVDDVAEKAKPALTDERLELVETWLAAHFYCMRDPRTTSERAGPVAAQYESMVGLNLAVSRYGQQAMVLDRSGILRALSSGKRQPRIAWVGTA